VFAADVSRAAVKKKSAPPRLAVRVAASAPSAGVSVVVDEDVHGCPRELVYARVTGLHAQVSAKGDSLETLREAEGSLALGAARLDLQTPETTSSPTVFAAGATGLSALSARASAAFSDGLHDDELSRNIGGSWRARSFSVDVAPMTIDLREAFGSSAPRAAARLAAPFAAGAAAPPAPPFPASPAAPAPQTPHLGFQSVRVGRIDAVVSFAALPFLPAGVRSIGAVDRARVTLRAFSLPSDARAAKLAAQKSSCFFPPETVARLAARHYLAESASQIVRLVASNKLLGDPARLWAELEAATRELFSSPPRVKSATRFSRRVAAAVAAWAKTLLRHARQVTSEMEERFEAAKRRRVERLRSRRIADDEEDAGDTSIGETKRQQYSRNKTTLRTTPIAFATRARRTPASSPASSPACSARRGTWWRARCRARSSGACPVWWRARRRACSARRRRPRTPRSRWPPTWRTNWRRTDSARRRRTARRMTKRTKSRTGGFPARVAGDDRRRDFARRARPPRPASSRGGLTRASSEAGRCRIR
jgi:hypothetical protein